MTDRTDDEDSRRARARPGEDRAERLAEALRANLKRRKAQARARRQGADQPAPGPDGKTDEGDG